MIPNTLSNRCRASTTAFALLAFFSAGCGPVRTPALDRARNAYELARRDPAVAGRAAVALEQTRATLERAEHLWATDKDVAEVEHLVALVEKRAEIAHATAKRRVAADEIQQILPQRQ